ADSSVALITAAGEIAVGGWGIEGGGADRFTILGAPRTIVRPSSSSSAPVMNLPARCDDIGGGGIEAGGLRDAGGGGMLAGLRASCTIALIDFDGMKFVTSSSLKSSAFPPEDAADCGFC